MGIDYKYKYEDNICKLENGILTFKPNTKIIMVPANDFNIKDNIEKIIIPDSATYIKKNGMAACCDLKEIIIPNSIQHIGEFGLMYTNSLKNVKLPDSIDSIGDSAFSYSGIEEITIPAKVSRLNLEVFSNCTYLKTVNFHKNITSIGEGAFRRCLRLGNIKLPEELEYIGSCAFMHCIKLEEIYIPKSVTLIESSAFYCCESLKTAIIDGPIKHLPTGLFAGKTSLEFLKLPDSITSINENVFGPDFDFSKLRVKYNSNNKTIDNWVKEKGCIALTSTLNAFLETTIEDSKNYLSKN